MRSYVVRYLGFRKARAVSGGKKRRATGPCRRQILTRFCAHFPMLLHRLLARAASAARPITPSSARHASDAASTSSAPQLVRPKAPWRSPKHARHEGPTPDEHRAHRETMKKRFPEGWQPPKKLSRDAMDGLRALHNHNPELFSTPVLAEKFKISPEAVRRILKSKWVPSKEREAQLLARERQSKQSWYEDKIRNEYEVDPQGDRPVREPGDKLYFRDPDLKDD